MEAEVSSNYAVCRSSLKPEVDLLSLVVPIPPGSESNQNHGFPIFGYAIFGFYYSYLAFLGMKSLRLAAWHCIFLGLGLGVEWGKECALWPWFLAGVSAAFSALHHGGSQPLSALKVRGFEGRKAGRFWWCERVSASSSHISPFQQHFRWLPPLPQRFLMISPGRSPSNDARPGPSQHGRHDGGILAIDIGGVAVWSQG